MPKPPLPSRRAEKRTMVPDSIVIDGTCVQKGGNRGERYLVIVDQQLVPLQPICFRFFAIFGIQLLLGEDEGWIYGLDICDPGRLLWAYIYRLRQNVHSASRQLQSWPVVENDKRGYYRLIVKPGGIAVNPANIYGFGDIPLEQMLDKLMSAKNLVAK